MNLTWGRTMTGDGGEEDVDSMQQNQEGFTLRENIDILTISLFVTGGGFATTAMLLQEFVDNPAVGEIQTVLYLIGLGFGGLVLLIKLLVRVSR